MKRTLQQWFLFSQSPDALPRLLQRSALLGMTGLLLVSFLAANVQALLWQSSQWLVSTILPAIVVELTNEERATVAAQPLRRNSTLDEAATRKAEHMAQEGYFAHYSPEGVSPWHWFDTVDYVYAHAGENLAIHFTDSGEVVDAWMRSPTHRANIVNSNFTEIGVGTARGTYQGYDTIFVVQLFGTPAVRPTLPEPQIRPAAVPLPVEPEESPAPPSPVATLTDFGSEVATLTPPLSPVAEVEGAGSAAPVASATQAVVLAESPASSSLAFAYETTPRTPDSAPAAPLPDLEVTNVTVTDEGVVMYSGLVATTTGLPVLLTAPASDTAGATETAFVARLATQPNTFLTMIYSFLAIVISAMLLGALALTVRAQRIREVVYTLGLLLLMTGLVALHLYVTAGAVVA
jgi:hypothetical protein